MVVLSQTRTMPVDRTLTGIAMSLGAMVIFSAMDGVSKLLTAGYHPLEISCIRALVTLVVLAPFVARSSASLRTTMPWHQLGRGLCMTGSSVMFILGLSQLPIADATSIGFVSPLLVTALSIPFLGEKVGLRRWSAVMVGFAGVLIVVRPGTGAFNPAALYPLLSAVSWALGLILTRQMRGSQAVLTTVFYSTVVGLLVPALALPIVWRAPDLQGWLLMALMGVFSAMGQSLTIAALTRAPASLVAPFSYSQILWSTLIGFFVFNTLPDAVTWVGAGIIVASGLYTLHRETVVHRRNRSVAGGAGA
jgi:drug/metabolite transporter (DMT)-like permease